jgi:hypothetical protein
MKSVKLQAKSAKRTKRINNPKSTRRELSVISNPSRSACNETERSAHSTYDKDKVQAQARGFEAGYELADCGNEGKPMSRASTNKQVNAEISVTGVYAEEWNDRNFAVGKKETAMLMFDDKGIVLGCSQAAEKLFDCSAKELAGQHVTRLLPKLIGINLVRGKRANPYLSYLSRIGHRFEVMSMNRTRFTSELFFNDMEYLGRRFLRVIINSVRKETP